MKVSIMPLVLKDLGRMVVKTLKILIPALILGVSIAFLCLSQAQAQTTQSTLVDSLDLSSGMITQKEIDNIEHDVKAVCNEIILLEKTKFTLEETLKTLYKENPGDSNTIVAIEKELFEKDRKIEYCRLIIIATCEKLTGLTVIVGNGKRASRYLYSGAQLWMHIQQDLYDAGF